MTGYNHDEVSVALHDCNFDTEQAINTLLEGRLDQVNILLLLLLLLLYTLHFARSIEGKELLPSFISLVFSLMIVYPYHFKLLKVRRFTY